MTQLRHCKCDNSNYFDRLLHGIGHRGSSFTDIDAVSHDMKTQRFLIQELKREGEKRDRAQDSALLDFARTLKKIPDHFTFWLVIRLHDERFVQWANYGDVPVRIAVAEYQARYRAWWDDALFVPAAVVTAPPVAPSGTAAVAIASRVERELTAEDIQW